MKIKELLAVIEVFAAPELQEEYDNAGLLTGVIVMVIAIIATVNAKETFGKDLNYIETI